MADEPDVEEKGRKEKVRGAGEGSLYEVRSIPPLLGRFQPRIVDKELEHELYIPDYLGEAISNIKYWIGENKLGFLNGKGALLTGFMGTGKTKLVKKIAKETDALLVLGSYDPKEIQLTFEWARESEFKPVIIFYDEIDQVGKKEDTIGKEYEIITELSRQIDGMEDNKGIYVMATSNYGSRIDRRLKRNGRLEYEIAVLPPNLKGRKEILEILASNSKVLESNQHKIKFEGKLLDEIAKITFGYTGADLRRLLSMAATHAQRFNRDLATEEDLVYALREAKPTAKKDMPFIEPVISLDDLVGYTELKDELKEILQREEGSTVLLYGPKGTGKSTIPKALAKTLGYSCMEKSAAALQNKFVGEGIKNLDELIDIGKIMAPAVIILDEVTGILEHAGLFSHKSDETSHFNSLFSTGPIKGIYFFGTTNNPTVINTTSLSRFEHKFFVDLPDAEERKGIFRHYIGWEIENIPEGVSCRDIQRAASLLKRKNEREYSHLFFQYLTPENKGQNWEKVREAIGDDLSLIKDYFGVKKDTVELLTSVEVYDKNKTTPREKKNG